MKDPIHKCKAALHFDKPIDQGAVSPYTSGMQSDIFKELDLLQKEINSYRPLSADFLNQIREYYKIGLTFSSNALEGNTSTL